MKPRSLFALFLLCAVVLSPCVFAADGIYTEYCFAPGDFAAADSLDGIFITAVPDEKDARLYLGSRVLCPGDAVPAEHLASLVLRGTDSEPLAATLSFFSVTDGHAEGATELKITVATAKNQPPVAEDSQLETYRNIENRGTLKAEDPDGDQLTFRLVTEPKRGTVEFSEDGTFLYTPAKNKVGKDSFVYTAEDAFGNVSGEATVSIRILKPSDKAAYSDLDGRDGAFYAHWMKEEGLLSGETVAGNFCFSPEKAVTRGEFLAMTMKLLGAEPASLPLSTGFADEASAPAWMRPYLVSALQNGMITGVSSSAGVVFRPTLGVTHAEAAVMLQNVLDLPTPEDSPVFAAEGTVPAWAEEAWSALACAGIRTGEGGARTLTRMEAAELLYQVAEYLKNNESFKFPWE